ncbi:MAG: MerR family transcriptional regulator [Thermoleophilia bacterium]|nr:MerR family transcriptional regulator [Thermoleophilia bacterium]
MSATESPELLFDVGAEKLLTIGSVVERLRPEFPDISVSKLRYLEEQGLVMPQRTKSGYRLFSETDFRRLVRVLAMQRDEYLPLKVIRRELERSPSETLAPTRQGIRKVDLVLPADGREFTAEELLQATGADTALLDELEEFELVRGRQVSGVRRYTQTEAGIVGAAVELARHGLRPKNLRLLKSAVDREAGLIEQVSLPGLRSQREERRREALDELEEIVQAMSQLRQLLLTRIIQRMTGGRGGA